MPEEVAPIKEEHKKQLIGPLSFVSRGSHSVQQVSADRSVYFIKPVAPMRVALVLEGGQID
jgi:hypothetical protein